MSKNAKKVSTLDVLRRDIVKGNIKVIWDIEDDDPALRFRMLQFIRNLVERTEPTTRLAYQIAHYMEANYLQIPGMDGAFPLGRLEFKQKHKQRLLKIREGEDEVIQARAQVRDLRAGAKAAGGHSQTHNELVEMAEEELATAEKKHEADKKDFEHKDTYPLSTDREFMAKGVDLADWAALKAFLKKKTTRRPAAAKESNFMKNTELLCDHLGFSQVERDALLALMISEEDSLFNGFLENLISGRQKNAHALFAKMIGVDRDVISSIFRAQSSLVRKGIIYPVPDLAPAEGEESASRREVLPVVMKLITKILKEPDLTLESMMRQFIGEPAKTHLDWDHDFAYLGEQGAQLIKLLEGAKTGHMKGVNILFYGVPGVGKTEAMKAAAAKAGLELYIVGERTRYGAEPTRKDRLAAAILAQEMLAGKPNAAIMLDEMEDLFPAQQSLAAAFGEASNDDDREPTGVSKVYLNRLLEENAAITLWGANNPEKFDPAFRRRVLYSLEFRVPPVATREKMWSNVATRHQFALSASDGRALASNYVVPPGLMENALRTAALTSGGIKAVEGSLRAASRLLFGSRRAIDARTTVPKEYDLRFINPRVDHSDFDLEGIAENIKASGRRDFSMLLYGVPGTGKTKYFAWLANHLGMDVLVKDAADMNDKYVGETEKRIVEAFEEARESESFLVIDEADTFLRRRQDLGNNYEVTAVGIMLKCMEDHPMPFGCTTNLFEDIDAAAKRRFLFKVAFQPLSPQQNVAAYQHFFGREAPAGIRQMTNLAPSDFVAVQKQSGFIPGGVSDERYLRLLKLEAQARMEEGASPYSGSRELGFVPGVK